jgi:hypothetical protein
MCGLVAIVSKNQNGFNREQIKALEEMVYINALRGVDSTGVFYVTNTGDVQTHKEAVESSKFLKSEEWKATNSELWSKGKAAVVHCRAATRGIKTDENAHPFVVDDRIVLVHNGTLWGDHKKHADVEVDSHAIAHVLAEEPDIATALKKINGAYALIWYDLQNRNLHMIRNKERPLWIGEAVDGTIMAASEQGFIWLTASRNGIKMKEKGVYPLPEYHLATINLDTYDIKIQSQEIDAKWVFTPPVTEVKKDTVPFQTTEETEKSAVKTASTPPALAYNKDACAYESGTGTPSKYKFPLDVAEDLEIGQWTPEGDNWNFRNFAYSHDKIWVEPMDYAPAFTGKKGHTYHLFGTIISTNKKINGMIATWTVESDNEIEVVNMSTFPYLEAKIEYAIGRPTESVNPKGPQTALWKVYDVKKCASLNVDMIQ